MRITKVLLIAGLLVLAATVSMAAPATLSVHKGAPQTSLCTEDPSAGCVLALPVGGTSMSVASDGEAGFDPWGYGADTSDQVALDALWVGGAGWTPCPNCTNPPFGGANIWVLPACGPLGCENGNPGEPIGKWDAPGNLWNFNGTIEWTLTEADGSVSDIMFIGNFGAVGVARRRFLK